MFLPELPFKAYLNFMKMLLSSRLTFSQSLVSWFLLLSISYYPEFLNPYKDGLISLCGLKSYWLSAILVAFLLFAADRLIKESLRGLKGHSRTFGQECSDLFWKS